jgi:lipopolysaccharide/colanic/teichoic acid biosynthesis glycosyltransferase/glycosyltransferase involved in cell wall biosynthesis
MRMMRPDVVHANSTKGGFLGRVAARLAGVRYVVFTAHGFVLGEEMGGMKRLALTAAEQIAGRLSDVIITVSEADRRIAVRHRVAEESRLVMIHNGVESPKSATLRPEASARAQLGGDSMVIGTIANFYPTKGLGYLLRAAKYVSDRMPGARFIVIGDGELRRQLEATRRQLGIEATVSFLGWRTDVDELLSQLDLFVLASVKEGMPFALLEAMARGLPIVATAVGGIPEALDGGRAGVLVPPRNADALAEAILDLLRNEERAKTLGISAKERASCGFGIEAMVTATDRVYRSLLGGDLSTRGTWPAMVGSWQKRGFDLFLSGFGLLLGAPLWVVIGLLIKLEDWGPIFYSQERVGLRGRVFRLYKFRSMMADAERFVGAVWADTADRRITSMGRILRATALDELPQLWNIFKGDMSVVGPRPERPEFVRQFCAMIAGYEKRSLVRPGLTGLAQVFGKYDSPPRQKLRYDLLYVKRRSVWLDVRLIVVSFWITFRGKWQDRGKKVRRVSGL